MRSSFVKSLFAAAAVSFGIAGAAHAGNVVQESSPVYWGSTGAYADLVLHVSTAAKAPVTMMFFIQDITGGNITQLVNQCANATPVKQGDTVVGYEVYAGGFCWFRAAATGASIVGHAMLSDTTANASNINSYVRSSLEIRDRNNNVLTHVEVH